MSYIYSQALVEAFSQDNCSDTDACAQSSGSHTPKPCLWHDKMTEPFRLSRFGMTCKPLTEPHGEALLTWWRAAFRAKTLAWRGGGRDWTASDQECGTTWPASLARYDPDTHTLKTPQLSLIEDLTGCSLTLPASGLMRDGECWERPMLGLTTSGTESGFWATPAASDATRGGKITDKMTGQSLVQMVNTPTHWPTPTASEHTGAGAGPNKKGAPNLRTAVTMWPTATATATAYKGWSQNHNRANTDDRLDYSVERQGFQPGQQTPPMRLNPDWVEWLMGWPIGQTALKPLETAKFQEWQQQHSISLEVSK